MSFAGLDRINPDNIGKHQPSPPEFPLWFIIFIVAILLVTAIMTIKGFKNGELLKPLQNQSLGENKPVPWPVSPMGQQFFFNQMMRRAGK